MRGDPVEPPFGCKPLEVRPGDKVRVTLEATVVDLARDQISLARKPGEIELSALDYAQEQWGAKIEVIEKTPPPPLKIGEVVECLDEPGIAHNVMAVGKDHICVLHYITREPVLVAANRWRRM